jgi:hypothetical protein
LNPFAGSGYASCNGDPTRTVPAAGVALALLACNAGDATKHDAPASSPAPQPAGAPTLHEQLLTLDTHLDRPANFAPDWADLA